VIGWRGGEARALGNFMEIGNCGCGEAKERGKARGRRLGGEQTAVVNEASRDRWSSRGAA
jgi:hypothetical protein